MRTSYAPRSSRTTRQDIEHSGWASSGEEGENDANNGDFTGSNPMYARTAEKAVVQRRNLAASASRPKKKTGMLSSFSLSHGRHGHGTRRLSKATKRATSSPSKPPDSGPQGGAFDGYQGRFAATAGATASIPAAGQGRLR